MASAFPYSPAYGLPDEVRLEILRDAEIHGVRAAAEMHRVSQVVIYRWRKAITDNPER